MNVNKLPFKPMLQYCVLQKHLMRMNYLHNCNSTLSVGLLDSIFSQRATHFCGCALRTDIGHADKWFAQSRTYAKKAIVKESKGKGKFKNLLTDEEMLEVIRVDVMRLQMQEVLHRLKDAFVQQLSVRSSSGSIENLAVTLEGEEFPLCEIAKIHKKNQNLVVINMTDCPEGLKATLQAVRNSPMNLNPQQDGTVIYVALPKVTRAHREALARSARSLLNKAKGELRDIQNAFQKDAKAKKEHFSEDTIFAVHSQIKELADAHALEGEKMLQAKEKELLSEL